MTKPIRPDEVTGAKQELLPAFVLEAFNELIVENFSGRQANVKQNTAIARILTKAPSATRNDVFARGWLEIEDVYRAEGWEVEYDKPGYNETYEASFTFARRR